MSLHVMRKPDPEEEDLAERIIGAAAEVHRELGPGLLASAYEACFCQEMKSRQLRFQQARPLAFEYKGVRLDCGYRIDFLVEDTVLVEMKAEEPQMKVSEVELRTYLKLMKKRYGLILNFFGASIRDGIRRIAL